MKKIVCKQIRLLSADEVTRVAGGTASETSRSDAAQTALSGSTGCGAGARNAYQSSSANRQSR